MLSIWHCYADFKDLTTRTASDKMLLGKVFNIAKNPKYHRYQSGLALMFDNFFDKRTSGGAIKIKICQTKNSNQSLENLKKEKYAHRL